MNKGLQKKGSFIYRKPISYGSIFYLCAIYSMNINILENVKIFHNIPEIHVTMTVMFTN